VASILALAAGCPRFLNPGSGVQDNTGNSDGTDNGTGDSGGGDADGGDGADTDTNPPTGGLVADHTAASAFAAIPSQYVGAAPATFHIFYGHTSHGSQIITGLDMIAATDAGYPAASALDITEYDGDLGTQGDLAWVAVTRDVLSQSGSDINLVMWSWCGGVSENTADGIDAYLEALDRLEQDYPDITFIYMTGHLDGRGPGENLYRGNNQIRAYCTAHDKILFDFADIESYDPDGNDYPAGSDACEWCQTWCAAHACPSCGDCAHSQCFNCYQKARAFWWLLARRAGWNGD
jgi:hypothetical protein